MASFQGWESFSIEAGDEMGHRITAFSSRHLGCIGKGVTICHGQDFFGMDHLIGRHGQGATGLF
jgi:hypothetical protein